MTRLHRLRLRPLSPWRTPWQADTLTGALCTIAARVEGSDFLRRRLLEPMLAGRPPFVLSDAFPGNLMPVPAVLRLADPPPGADRKALKRARWLRFESFLAVRAGRSCAPGDAVRDCDVFVDEVTRHNTLARDCDASLEEGGLFSRPDTMLRAHVRRSDGLAPQASGNGSFVPNPILDGAEYLSLYFRAADGPAIDLLLELLYALSQVGFGADVATGRGQFEVVGEPEPVLELDQPPLGSDGVIIPSTFQPGPQDPTEGLWETFPKFGKLGPDHGLRDVQKHTLILLRPGACFRVDRPRPFLGHALTMGSILPLSAADEMRRRNVEVIHAAFGLTVPMRLGLPEYAWS